MFSRHIFLGLFLLSFTGVISPSLKAAAVEEECEKHPFFTHRNPFPETNDEYDRVLENLSAPIKAELSHGEYLTLAGQDPEDAKSHLYFAVLESGQKVVIKRKRLDMPEGRYTYPPSEAVLECATARMARDFFEKPLLPPMIVIQRDDGTMETRQYFFEGGYEPVDKASTARRVQDLTDLLLHPELFKRPAGFLDFMCGTVRFISELEEELLPKAKIEHLSELGEECIQCHPFIGFRGALSAFESLIGAEDRNETNYVFTGEGDERRFAAIDYAEQLYMGFEDSAPEGDPKALYITLSSIGDKMRRLAANYRSYFEGLTELDPDHFTEAFFANMEKHQAYVLGEQEEIEDFRPGSEEEQAVGRSLLQQLLGGIEVRSASGSVSDDNAIYSEE